MGSGEYATLRARMHYDSDKCVTSVYFPGPETSGPVVKLPDPLYCTTLRTHTHPALAVSKAGRIHTAGTLLRRRSKTVPPEMHEVTSNFHVPGVSHDAHDEVDHIHSYYSLLQTLCHPETEVPSLLLLTRPPFF